MLERPNLSDEQIQHSLHEAYRLTLTQVTFLPIGYDMSASVFRVQATDDHTYFLKAKTGEIKIAQIRTLILFQLTDQAAGHLIHYWPIRTGRLWGEKTGSLFALLKMRCAFQIQNWSAHTIGEPLLKFGFEACLPRVQAAQHDASLIVTLHLPDAIGVLPNGLSIVLRYTFCFKLGMVHRAMIVFC